MPNKHAVLSASSSGRWTECPPSAMLNAAAGDITSEYAAQGTDAHTLCEYKVQKALGRNARDPTENLTYFDEEMSECSDSYCQYVMERIVKARENCKDPIVLVEQRLDFSEWVPNGFGTGDCVIVGDDELTVIDMKFGVGLLVNAERNTQMMLYALGAIAMLDGIYDIRSVTMTIFQPRRANVSTYAMTKDELLDWAENVLKPIAALAAKGEGEFKAGDHCRFCKVKSTCRKRAEYNLELARYDFEPPTQLTDTEVEAVLEKADSLAAWCADVKEYALNAALGGKRWSRWKAVEGRSTRKYVDEKAVADKVIQAGYDPYEHKVLGITAMTKMLGKAKFEEMLGGLTHKPPGKPTLVKMSDKRPAISKAVTAAEDFKEDN